LIWLALYVMTIPAANWAITQYGVIPIGFGLLAPAGVLFAGLAFTLRDLVQEQLGKAWVLAAIGAGGLLSLLVSDPFVAAASATAFLVSELCDFAVYSPLRARGLVRAVVASNVVGMAVDSALFLSIAGFPLALLGGLMVGKLYTILPAIAVIMALRQYRAPVLGELAR
jgi:uncharacterized PurR-regulated membrane protein YhhQ (DUF165 family)